MMRLMLGMAICLFTLGSATPAEAAPRRGPAGGLHRGQRHGHVHRPVHHRHFRGHHRHFRGHYPRHFRGYHHRHGVRYSGGYFYRGRHHSHWTRRVWSPVYRRWHFWDPYVRSFYYFNSGCGCYYPCR